MGLGAQPPRASTVGRRRRHRLLTVHPLCPRPSLACRAKHGRGHVSCAERGTVEAYLAASPSSQAPQQQLSQPGDAAGAESMDA
jgi:hypothetical protein